MGRYYTVDTGNGAYNCVLKGNIKTGEDNTRFSNPAAVGDDVEITLLDDGTGVLNEVLTRRNAFTRRDKGRQREDLIAANLDLVVVIQSFGIPAPNLRFADRVLVRARREGIAAMLCVNKADLADSVTKKFIKRYYKDAEVSLSFISAADGEGMTTFRKKLSGISSILIGTSGVGKTTIINSLTDGKRLSTGDVSVSTGKGRHTTTNVEMIELAPGTSVTDTPGMRAFGLIDIEPSDLTHCFADFEKYSEACSFSPCSHMHEPECGIKSAVENGLILEERYISYMNILASLMEFRETRYR